MKKISQKERKKQIEQTHNEHLEKLKDAANEYNKSSEKIARYQEVKLFFESLDETTPHPGVSINEIDLSNNDRSIDTSSEEFKALKESIVENGLLQRPVLTLGLTSEKPFLCVAGHRRIFAFIELGRKSIPADLMFTNNEMEIRKARLSENLVRQNLEPLELAEAVDRLKLDLNQSTAGIARILNKDRQYITELLKIAKWPDDIKELVKKEKIKIGALGRIAKRKLTTEEVRNEVKKLAQGEVLGNPTPKRSGATSQKNVQKRNRYFKEKKLSDEGIEIIMNFLKENNIKSWL